MLLLKVLLKVIVQYVQDHVNKLIDSYV